MHQFEENPVSVNLLRRLVSKLLAVEENFHVIPHLKALTESIDALALYRHDGTLKTH